MGVLLKILQVLMAIVNLKKAVEPPRESEPEPEPDVPVTDVTLVTEQPARPVIEVVPVLTHALKKRGYSKDIEHCRPKLRQAWEYAQPKFLARHPALWCRCDFTWRSEEFQRKLYAKGRKWSDETNSWTVIDPRLIVTKVLKSHHNTWLSDAFDFIIFSGKKPLWITKETAAEVAPLYREFGKLLATKKVVSGAIWKYRWKDYGHVQGSYGAV